MTGAEVRKLNDEELVKELAERKEELFNLRFQLATNQLDNTARFREVRSDIARINTEIRARELASTKERA